MENDGSFPDDFNNSDTLMIMAILECNQFFMVSWLDAVTTTLPYLNMLSGLRSIKFLVQHDMEVIRAVMSAKVCPTEAALNLAKLENVVLPGHQEVRVSGKAPAFEENQVETKRSIWGRRVAAGIVAIMPICGVFVLLTSIASSGIFLGVMIRVQRAANCECTRSSHVSALAR